MNFSKEFISIIESNQYVGIGNPNAKILLVGKEAGIAAGVINDNGGADSWKTNNQSYKRFVPIDIKQKNHRHTWQKYQKLYELIEVKLNIEQIKNDKYEITFVENVFTTELSNLGAPTTREAKMQSGFKDNLKKRKEEF